MFTKLYEISLFVRFHHERVVVVVGAVVPHVRVGVVRWHHLLLLLMLLLLLLLLVMLRVVWLSVTRMHAHVHVIHIGACRAVFKKSYNILFDFKIITKEKIFLNKTEVSLLLPP